MTSSMRRGLGALALLALMTHLDHAYGAFGGYLRWAALMPTVIVAPLAVFVAVLRRPVMMNVPAEALARARRRAFALALPVALFVAAAFERWLYDGAWSSSLRWWLRPTLDALAWTTLWWWVSGRWFRTPRPAGLL